MLLDLQLQQTGLLLHRKNAMLRLWFLQCAILHKHAVYEYRGFAATPDSKLGM